MTDTATTSPAEATADGARAPGRPFLIRNLPFLIVHLGMFAAFWTGVSWPAIVVCLGLYWMRVFFVTGFYHRYFSHRTYQTSRVFQFVMAFLGTTALQKGPLWWSGHHRYHHRHSDDEFDVHSPKNRGFWWAHVGWLIDIERNDTRWEEIKGPGAVQGVALLREKLPARHPCLYGGRHWPGFLDRALLPFDRRDLDASIRVGRCRRYGAPVATRRT